MEIERMLDELEESLKKKVNKDNYSGNNEVWNRLEKIEAKISELETIIDKLVPTLHILKDSIDIAESNAKKFGEVRTLVAELRRDFEAERSEIEKIKSEVARISGLDEVVERLSSSLKKMEFKIDGSINEEIIKVKEELEKIHVDVDNLREGIRRIEIVEKAISEILPVFDRVKNRLNTIETVDSRIDNLRSSINGLRNEVSEVKMKIGMFDTLRDKVSDLSNEILEIMRSIKKLDTKIESGLVEKMFRMDDRINGLKLEIEKVKTKVEKLEKPIFILAETERRVDLLEEEIEELLRSVGTRKKTKREVRKEVKRKSTKSKKKMKKGKKKSKRSKKKSKKR